MRNTEPATRPASIITRLSSKFLTNTRAIQNGSNNDDLLDNDVVLCNPRPGPIHARRKDRRMQSYLLQQEFANNKLASIRDYQEMTKRVSKLRSQERAYAKE